MSSRSDALFFSIREISKNVKLGRLNSSSSIFLGSPYLIYLKLLKILRFQFVTLRVEKWKIPCNTSVNQDTKAEHVHLKTILHAFEDLRRDMSESTTELCSPSSRDYSGHGEV